MVAVSVDFGHFGRNRRLVFERFDDTPHEIIPYSTLSHGVPAHCVLGWLSLLHGEKGRCS